MDTKEFKQSEPLPKFSVYASRSFCKKTVYKIVGDESEFTNKAEAKKWAKFLKKESGYYF